MKSSLLIAESATYNSSSSNSDSFRSADLESEAQTPVALFDVVLSERHSLRARKTEHPVETGVMVSDHVIQEDDELTIEGIINERDRADERWDTTGEAQKFRNWAKARAAIDKAQSWAAQGTSIGGVGLSFLLPSDPEKAKLIQAGRGGVLAATNNSYSWDIIRAAIDTNSGLDFGRGRPMNGRGFFAGTGNRRPVDLFEKFEGWKKAGTVLDITTDVKNYPSMVLLSIDAPRDKATGRALRFSLSFREIRFVEAQFTKIPKRKRSSVNGASNTANSGTQGKGKVTGTDPCMEAMQNYGSSHAFALGCEPGEDILDSWIREGESGITLDPAVP